MEGKMNCYKIIFLGDKKVIKQNFLDNNSSEGGFDFHIEIKDIQNFKVKLIYCKLYEKDIFKSLISNLKKETMLYFITSQIKIHS